MEDRLHEAWVITAAGEDTSRRFHVPGEFGELKPYVQVRPLTAREALHREAVGLEERYELRPDGAPAAMMRRYDHEAMMQFEVDRCLVDYALPMRMKSAEMDLAGPDDVAPSELLDRLPVRLVDWLEECLAIVNMRTPEGAEVLAEGKGG